MVNAPAEHRPDELPAVLEQAAVGCDHDESDRWDLWHCPEAEEPAEAAVSLGVSDGMD